MKEINIFPFINDNYTQQTNSYVQICYRSKNAVAYHTPNTSIENTNN